jgi:hypoxanthine-DNA glycosylase
MRQLRGFAAVGAENPSILILGSFPSAKSLERREYYGHERNHFWPLMGIILGFDPGAPYLERLGRLERAGIALWDVIAACEREGSLDQDIRGESANPLAEFIASRPTIERLGLNGGKAASAFVGLLAPSLGGLEIGKECPWTPPFSPRREILIARLPSSSPVPTRNFRKASDKLPAWSAFVSPTPRESRN